MVNRDGAAVEESRRSTEALVTDDGKLGTRSKTASRFARGRIDQTSGRPGPEIALANGIEESHSIEDPAEPAFRPT